MLCNTYSVVDYTEEIFIFCVLVEVCQQGRGGKDACVT